MEGATRLLSFQLAEVLAVNEEDRTVNVRWIGTTGSRNGIPLINDAGSYSLPRPGDAGLVLGDGREFYFLGKVEFKYRGKIGPNGFFDKGEKITFPKVKDSEVHITNVKDRTWLRFFRGGSFGLMSGFMEGMEYLSNTRMTRLVGKTVAAVGNGVNVYFGNAIRSVPVRGESPIVGTSGGKALEILMQIAYQGVQTVRFHLGEIKDLSLGLVDELSGYGSPIRAILEVTAAAVVMAFIKMDLLGNVEVNAKTGSLNLDALQMVQLGDLTKMAAQQPLVKGSDLLVWLNAHTHQTAWGPSGPAITGTYGEAPASMLSAKVMLIE